MSFEENAKWNACFASYIHKDITYNKGVLGEIHLYNLIIIIINFPNSNSIRGLWLETKRRKTTYMLPFN